MVVVLTVWIADCAGSAGANSVGGEWRVVLTVWRLTVLTMLVLTVPMTAQVCAVAAAVCDQSPLVLHWTA